MNIYFWVDQPDLGDSESQFIEGLTAFVVEHKEHAELVNTQSDGQWSLGIDMKIKATKQLVAPLNALYPLAKMAKCDFVVGFVEEGSREDVCYFGYEEGKADAFEVACYLGLSGG